jgi:hypothetical protein
LRKRGGHSALSYVDHTDDDDPGNQPVMSAANFDKEVGHYAKRRGVSVDNA